MRSPSATGTAQAGSAKAHCPGPCPSIDGDDQNNFNLFDFCKGKYIGVLFLLNICLFVCFRTAINIQVSQIYNRNLFTWICFRVLAPEARVVKTTVKYSTIMLFNSFLTEAITWHYFKLALVLVLAR